MLASQDTTPTAPASRAPLTKRRKAAMIIQLLNSQGHHIPLGDLPEEMQLTLTREIGSMRLVDRSTLHAVALEFAEVLDSIGLTSPRTIEEAVDKLSDQISETAANKLREEAAAKRIALDPWAQLNRLEEAELAPILQSESTEVAAVVLSKLPVAKAATILGLLPGDDARRITLAISQTTDVLPGTVNRIGHALAMEHCMKPTPAFTGEADERVGAILDSSPANTRDSVLEGISSDDPDFAEKVRKAIFTFADIPSRIKPLDVPNVTRGVDGPSLITALTFGLSQGGPEAEAAEFILGNMSQRMADQLREDIADRGKIRRADGEDAMKELIGRIREGVDGGEFTLVEVEDEDEDA